MDAEMPVQQKAEGAPKSAARRRRGLFSLLFSGNALRILTINTTFGLLVGLLAYATTERNTLFRWMGFPGAGGISGAGQAATEKNAAAGRPIPLVGASSLAADDPVLHFAETHVGQLLFTQVRSDSCQRVLFDNRTGESFDVPGVFCGQPAQQLVESESPKRLEAVRASFRRQ